MRLLFVCLISCSTFGGEALNLPIHIQEALPGNVAQGWNRQNEWVRLGVPLQDSDAITSVSQLGIDGLSDFQFSVLDRYPSNNIRWVLVDMLVSLNANQSLVTALVPGSGNSPGPNLALEGALGISIDTGPLQAEVSRLTGSILESVIVDGVDYIENIDNDSGLRVRNALGVDFFSGNDIPSRTLTLSLEDNGPVRATVLIEGFLYDGSGVAGLRFGVRLHFVKGSRTIQAEVTWKNDAAGGGPVNLAAADFRVDTALTGTIGYQLEGLDLAPGSGAPEIFSGNLGAQLNLVQGQSEFRSDSDDLATRWVNFEGYRLFTSDIASPMNSSSGVEDHARGFAVLTDATRTVNMVYRRLSGHWSGGFHLESSDALFAFSLISDDAVPGAQPLMRFSYFAHEFREFMLAFGNARPGGDWENLYNYPLFAVCDVETYRRSGAIWNNTRIPEKADIDTFFAHPAHGAPPGSDLWPNFSEERLEEYPWQRAQVGIYKDGASSGGGPDGNYDYPTDFLIRTILARLGSYYLMTEARVRALVDLATCHADNFSLASLGFANESEEIASAGIPTSNGIGAGYKRYLESEHPHWLAVVTWYFMSGDRRLHGSIEDLLDHRTWHSWGGNFEMDLNQAPNLQERWYSYELRSLNVTSYLNDMGFSGGNSSTCLSRMQDELLSEVNDLVNQDVAGWAPNRGFFSGGFPDISTLFFVEKHAENMDLNESLFRNSFPGETVLHQRLRDRLEGFAYFTRNELYPSGNLPDTWYIYDLFVSPSLAAIDYITNSSLLMARGYERTGDGGFLDGFSPFVLDGLAGFTQNNNGWTNFQALRFIFDYTHRTEVEVGCPILTIDDQGGGSYLVSWTNPAGVDVAELVLKYSQRTIVDDLGFEPCPDGACAVGRGYELDPVQYIAFWAADEPLSGPLPGETSFLLTGLPTGLDTDNFKLKYLNRFAATGLSVDPGGGGPGEPCAATPVLGGGPAICADVSELIAAWRQTAESQPRFEDTNGNGLLDVTELSSLVSCVGDCSP